MGKGKQEMKEKNWKKMGSWEKAWKVTKTVGLGIVAIAVWLLTHAGRSSLGREGSLGRGGSPSGGGPSVWIGGGSGKKPGSWSSGRHKQR